MHLPEDPPSQLAGRFERWPLKVKLSWLILGPMILWVVCFAFWLNRYHFQQLQSVEIETTRSIIRALGEDFVALSLFEDPVYRADMATRLSSFADIEQLVVLKSGEINYYYGRSGLAFESLPDQPADGVEIVQGRLHLYESLAADPSGHTSVYIRVDVSDVVARSRRDRLWGIAFGLSLTGFAFLSFYWVSKLVTEPIAAIGNLLRRVVSEQQYSHRVKLRRSDEIGLLDHGVNSLLARIQQSLEEKERSEQKREQLITELEAKNADLEEFTYSVSHDLKGPLVNILGFLGYLEENLAGGNLQDVGTDIVYIRSSATHMRSMLDGLLEVLKGDRSAGERGPVDLGSVVHEVCNLLSFQLAEQGIDLQISPELPVVQGNRAGLNTVFLNLISNAIKFLGAQPSPKIEIGTTGAAVYVKDNGCGLGPQCQESIFRLFKQLNPKTEGTGIGLSLAERMMHAHGGKIWAESEGKGMGTTFWLAFDPPASIDEQT